MDRPEISVTDESQFSDFYQSNETKWEDLQDTVKKIYGINIEIEDYLWETAEKIYNGNEN
jgi:aldehyde:ferredoxin oxidoreductase